VRSMRPVAPSRNAIDLDTPSRLSIAAVLAFSCGSIAASGLGREGASVSAGAGQRPRQ
jgi:hypothetical protein